MSTTSDPEVEVQALEAALEAMRTEREELGERIGRVASEVSGWSVQQHLYHVALATDLALRNVRALCAGKGRLITQEGGPTELAVEVLTRGSYPRGESQAPRMVQPPAEVDPEFLEMEMRGNRESVPGVRALLGEIPGAGGRIPHHVLGELNAGEWLRFARLHAEHHLAIVRDVRQAVSAG